MGGFVRMLNPNLMVAVEANRMFRAFNPVLNQVIVEAARTRMRTQRFVELVRDAMGRTGRVQVELNPCDVWNAEELMAAMRMARQPLSLQLGGRSYQANLQNVRVRCPSTMAEWDYDLIWVLGAERSMFRGSVTLLGQQVLMASLDPPMERPIFASICYRNFEILRLDVPQQVTSRFGPEYFNTVRDGLIREASALPLCISMLRLPMIGIG